MKRLFGLLAAFVLVFSACCAAAEGVKFSTEYFSLQLPENWIIDTEDLESKEGEQSLGYFGGPADVDLVGGAFLVYYEDLKDFALWNASEDEVKDYADALLEEFGDCNPVLVGTVTAGKIPLILIRGSDEEGEFLYADTMTNGYAIQFEFYVSDEEGEQMYPLTDEHIELVKTILATFQPAA